MLLRALPLVVPFLGLSGLLASILLEKLSVDDFLFALSIPFGLAIHPFLQALRRHSARQNGPRNEAAALVERFRRETIQAAQYARAY